MPLTIPASPSNTDLNALLKNELARLQTVAPTSTPPALFHEIISTQGRPSLAQLVDHTLLAPTATKEQVIKLCDEALQNGFKSVCVNSVAVGWAVEYINSVQANPGLTKPVVCVVVGFPLGAVALELKLAEAKYVLAAGAKELDMVPYTGHLKSRDYVSYLKEIQTIVQAARDHGPDIIVKVIIETSQLTRDEIVAASLLTGIGGADFVKTSTGFVGAGAKVEDVRVMKEVIKGFGGKVKASGGVRDVDAVKEMVKAGAERIGTSSGLKIVSGGAASGSGY